MKLSSITFLLVLSVSAHSQNVSMQPKAVVKILSPGLKAYSMCDAPGDTDASWIRETSCSGKKVIPWSLYFMDPEGRRHAFKPEACSRDSCPPVSNVNWLLGFANQSERIDPISRPASASVRVNFAPTGASHDVLDDLLRQIASRYSEIELSWRLGAHGLVPLIQLPNKSQRGTTDRQFGSCDPLMVGQFTFRNKQFLIRSECQRIPGSNSLGQFFQQFTSSVGTFSWHLQDPSNFPELDSGDVLSLELFPYSIVPVDEKVGHGMVMQPIEGGDPLIKFDLQLTLDTSGGASDAIPAPTIETLFKTIQNQEQRLARVERWLILLLVAVLIAVALLALPRIYILLMSFMAQRKKAQERRNAHKERSSPNGPIAGPTLYEPDERSSPESPWSKDLAEVGRQISEIKGHLVELTDLINRQHGELGKQAERVNDQQRRLREHSELINQQQRELHKVSNQVSGDYLQQEIERMLPKIREKSFDKLQIDVAKIISDQWRTKLAETNETLRALLVPSAPTRPAGNLRSTPPVLNDDSRQILSNLCKICNVVPKILCQWSGLLNDETSEADRLRRELGGNGQEKLAGVLLDELRAIRNIAFSDQIFFRSYLQPEGILNLDFVDLQRQRWRHDPTNKQGAVEFGREWLGQRLPYIQALVEGFVWETGPNLSASLVSALAACAIDLGCPEDQARDFPMIMAFMSNWLQDSASEAYRRVECSYQKIRLYHDTYIGDAAPDLLKQLKESAYEFSASVAIGSTQKISQGTIIRVPKPVIRYLDARREYQTQGRIEFYSDRMAATSWA